VLFPVGEGGQTEWCICCSFLLALAGCAGCDAREEAGLLLGLADPLFLSDVVVGLVKDFILI